MCFNVEASEAGIRIRNIKAISQSLAFLYGRGTNTVFGEGAGSSSETSTWTPVGRPAKYSRSRLLFSVVVETLVNPMVIVG